jgi:hypothetical protein
LLTGSICKICSTGFQLSEKRDDCTKCEIGTYSSPVRGVSCSTCESIEDFDLCESVRGPSSEECFWIGGSESESEGHCVVKV